MSLLEDVKPVEKKTAMIYGKNDNRLSPAFEFEDVKDKFDCEFNDFQKRVLEEILDKSKDLVIVPQRCGKTWLYNVLGLSYMYELIYGESPNVSEFLEFAHDTVYSSHDFLTASRIFTMEIREPKERTISDIKKEIKHEKNPLRLKQLNKELNTKYKELKSGRK